jgi:hypothetical protein
MTLRAILGLGWSLVVGLTGGWLFLAPWALGEQRAGDWTIVTKSELGAGAGLVALALVGIAIVAAQAVRTLRESGALGRVQPSGGPAEGVTASPEMEKALIALAQALAEDLDAHREPEPSGSAGESVWRQSS